MTERPPPLPAVRQLTCPRCGGTTMTVLVGPGKGVDHWCVTCRVHVPVRRRLPRTG